MLTKVTRKLFMGMYQYKLVLVCAGASWFRGKDWDTALEMLSNIDISTGKLKNSRYYVGQLTAIKTQHDLDYALKLHAKLSKLDNIEVRVESPWISVYSNSKSDIDSIAKLDSTKVKYICVPPNNAVLDDCTIIMPKINYQYRITLGKTTHEHSTFIAWAENNPKLKLTKTCKRELARNQSWGGSYFYVTGDNNLLMAKMHLGGSINKVERIIKA